MKILFSPCHYVYDDGDRGSELSWAYQLADRIAHSYPESVVVTGFKNVKQKKDYRVIELQPKKKAVDLGVKNTLLFNLLYSRCTNRLLRQEKYDVVHHVLPFAIDRTFNLSFLFGAARAAKKVIGPIQSPLPVYHDNLHDVAAKQQRTTLITLTTLLFTVLHPLLAFLSTKTLKRADMVIVINEKTKQLLIERGIDKKKIRVIPPGIDCGRFLYSEKKKSKTIEILAVGALIRRKGFDVLLQGIAEVIKTQRNIKVRLVGDGPQKRNLQRQVRALGLEKYVVFEGHVPHHAMGPFYKRAQIFVSTSRAEGFATVCLEAMASGLAIVSAEVGGFSDAIQNDKNGYLINQEDYKHLALKITALLTNEALLHTFARNARRDTEMKYDWKDVIVPQYITVYKSI